MAEQADAILFTAKREDEPMGANGLTNAMIDAIEDILEAMTVAEDSGVGIDGLETVPEIKARLRSHLNLERHGNCKNKIEAQLYEMGLTDLKNRQKLTEMVQELKCAFPAPTSLATTTKRQTMVEQLLDKDGTTADIRSDCDRRLASLQEKECVILVSGESSAGKSSLLNLLLGEDILPSHMLPCTSCITVVRYSPKRMAIILFRDEHIEKIPNLDKEGLERLQQRAYFSGANRNKPSQVAYDERKEDHNVAEIQVFLPLKMLQGGLVLVDTPGIGENEFLENYLMEYIRTRQILGFMYIIMTDNALGIAEDRLINLMSLIIKSQKSSSDVVKFNPRAALFVCNRWDMVPEDRREAVRKYALQQLEKSWPDFDPKQAVFFSTRNALREQQVNAGYITDEFVALLHSLHSLVSTSLDKRVQATYRWLGTVLQRSVHYLRTMVRKLDMSGRQRQTKAQETTSKLNTLTKKADGVIKHLFDEMEFAVHDICEKVKLYMQTQQAKTKLTHKFGSKDGELPDMNRASGTWEWVKRQIDAAFDNRVVDLLEEWDKENAEIKKIEKRLFREAKLQLCDLESEISEIEKDSQEKQEPMSLSASGAFLNHLCQSIEDFEEEDLLLDTIVPNKLLAQLARKFTKTIQKKKEDSKLKEYASNPSKIAQKRAEKLLNLILKEKDTRLEMFVREFLSRPFNYIHRLKSKIPSLIESNKALQAKFEKEIVDEVKSRQHYIDMMVKMEELRKSLVTYGENNVYCNDFENDDIELVILHRDSTKGRPLLLKRNSLQDLMLSAKRQTTQRNNSATLPHGRWHAVHMGKINRGSECRYVAVKIYAGHAKVENILHEVAKLRCLLHNDVCIAEFLGVHARPDAPTPALIFAGKLQSVKNFLKTHVSVDTTKMMRDVLAGLHYIHSKGLVHMELNKYSTTVDEHGDVKLTGSCLPRSAELFNPSSDLDRKYYMYLAPEVLQGALYVSNADMFAFALLVLEIKNPEVPDVYCNMPALASPEEFLKMDPADVLRNQVDRLDFPPVVKQSLLRCLSLSLTDRPNASVLSTLFRHLDKPIRKNTATPSSIFRSRRK